MASRIASPARRAAVAVGLFVSTSSVSPSEVRRQPREPGPEVRQIVTFLFQPGRLPDALAVYADRLLPIYVDVPPLIRFRAYREAESPEPLDLVVVSTYAGMAGIDAANVALGRPHRSGRSAFALYGELSRMTASHHDQFVEMIAPLGDASHDDDGLTVFEYVRVAPGRHEAFERLLAARVRPFERDRSLYQWTETGRMLVADGWDYLRLFGVRSLEEWQTSITAVRGSDVQADLAPLVAARKTIVLRSEPRLSVR